MESFVQHDGIVVPLLRSNVNTDDIIPARFLKSVRRTGFAAGLFGNWRYLADGRTLDPGFVLNRPQYAGASILVARDNFGCGSSREHAPWALNEYGIRCIVAIGFADIFHTNCFNSGILPITLDAAQIDVLVKSLDSSGPRWRVDLPAQTLTAADGNSYSFAIDPFKKRSLLAGLDNIDWSLAHRSDTLAYERRRRNEAPWLFPTPTE
ncbi:3-isopropylmalate dehydratase small subunit [Kribbella antibiotica]|uniref:3-isopropylmalate dehydratase small subunit n=1 Tax=Kribbella antibiotica TaxID=190195 RepID=A0A4R4Z905_9ACTN|nr:3-isopropylmalate dehydratase small subunit [Kribbella antibiotica]TDD54180.1 3-isopropylmalate dehydratase small subunit [Kribbella antibiotica]